MNRKLLAKLLTVFCLIAVGAIFFAFFGTLMPSERSNADRPSVPMPILKSEQFVYVKNPAAPVNQPSELLFMRGRDGKLKVWEVPLARSEPSVTQMGGRELWIISGERLEGNEHRMPDIHWWRPGPPCKQFRPDFHASRISCEDKGQGEWAAQNYQWSLEGKNLAQQGVDDMIAVDGEEEAGQYVFYKKY